MCILRHLKCLHKSINLAPLWKGTHGVGVEKPFNVMRNARRYELITKRSWVEFPLLLIVAGVATLNS